MSQPPPDTTLTTWIQDAMDRGATTVEEIHKAVAELPLDVLEQNGLFERTAAEVREVQDRSIGAVYDLIRDVNRRVGELATDLLESRRADA